MVTYVQDYKLLDAVVHVLLILEKKKGYELQYNIYVCRAYRVEEF